MSKNPYERARQVAGEVEMLSKTAWAPSTRKFVVDAIAGGIQSTAQEVRAGLLAKLGQEFEELWKKQDIVDIAEIKERYKTFYLAGAASKKAENVKLLEALQSGTMRYSCDRGEPDPTPAFPTEVVFSIPQWKKIQAALKAAEGAPCQGQ